MTSLTNKCQQQELWLRLSLLAKIGPVTIKKLVSYFGSIEAVFGANIQQLQRVLPNAICVSILNAFENKELNTKISQITSWLHSSNKHHVICQEDANYPPLLKQLADAPAVLYVIGNASLLKQPQIAIVGSRKASRDGINNCKIFATHLANYGLTITSGMALGIDAIAHSSTLAANGKTIAVLGCGVNVVYPKKHYNLYQDIAFNGAIVSEFPLGTTAIAGNFPRRNRIVTGMALGLLVVEAAIASGSLISANFAAEQGKDVFAIPGSILNPFHRGCHQLIRDGAILTETPDDILLELAPHLNMLDDNICNHHVADPLQEKIISCIGQNVISLDEINLHLNIDAGDLAAILTEMEIAGMIEATAGGFIVSR